MDVKNQNTFLRPYGSKLHLIQDMLQTREVVSALGDRRHGNIHAGCAPRNWRCAAGRRCNSHPALAMLREPPAEPGVGRLGWPGAGRGSDAGNGGRAD